MWDGMQRSENYLGKVEFFVYAYIWIKTSESSECGACHACVAYSVFGEARFHHVQRLWRGSLVDQK